MYEEKLAPLVSVQKVANEEVYIEKRKIVS